VRAVFDRRNEFQLGDSAEYYFEAIQRIASPRYLPMTEDVLRSRVWTTGIVQSDFRIHSNTFTMFDVGGQRNERRKWIHCFDHVNAVCFVAAISEFDQVCHSLPHRSLCLVFMLSFHPFVSACPRAPAAPRSPSRNAPMASLCPLLRDLVCEPRSPPRRI
jgi:hypothetical protein